MVIVMGCWTWRTPPTSPDPTSSHSPLPPRCAGEFFAQLNTALCPDALCCIVPEGVQLPDPVHVVYVAQGAAAAPAEARAVSAPRLLVVVGAKAGMTLLEEFVGAGEGSSGAYLSCPTAEVRLAEGARLSHSVLQDQHREGLHLKVRVAGT